MKITSKRGEELNFLESGVDGIYVLDRVAFRGYFDREGNNDWEKSSGKKGLQEWAKVNLPKEILERFDVDLPTVEEVFSQKMLNLYELGRNLESKQLPIFQNSDNRMMQCGGRIAWWWTRSAHADFDADVWLVNGVGAIDYYGAYNIYSFVPVLRAKA